jgi:hypothetical protein
MSAACSLVYIAARRPVSLSFYLSPPNSSIARPPSLHSFLPLSSLVRTFPWHSTALPSPDCSFDYSSPLDATLINSHSHSSIAEAKYSISFLSFSFSKNRAVSQPQVSPGSCCRSPELLGCFHAFLEPLSYDLINITRLPAGDSCMKRRPTGKSAVSTVEYT